MCVINLGGKGGDYTQYIMIYKCILHMIYMYSNRIREYWLHRHEIKKIGERQQKYNCKKKPAISRYLRSIWKNCSYWSEALAASPVKTDCRYWNFRTFDMSVRSWTLDLKMSQNFWYSRGSPEKLCRFTRGSFIRL